MLPTLHVFNSCVAFTHFSQLSICECRIIFFFLSFVNRMGYLLMHTTPLAANQIKIVICLLFGTATVVGIYYVLAIESMGGEHFSLAMTYVVWPNGLGSNMRCHSNVFFISMQNLSILFVVDPFNGCGCVYVSVCVLSLANSDLSTTYDLCRGKDKPLSIRILFAINIVHFVLPLKWKHTFANVQFVFAVVYMMALSHAGTCVRKTVLSC